MPKPIIRPWWVAMIQGIALIIMSIYVLNNPLNALKGISVWIGVLIFFTGIVGIVSWLFADRDAREVGGLIWSLITFVLGILMLMHLFATTRMITILFGLWMVFLGLHFIESGLIFKKHQPFRWTTVIAGLICIFAAVVLIFNLGTGAGASLFIGVQMLLGGIALIIISFARKEMANNLGRVRY
ncbi:MAG TPA: DUF308 domain-containing protein [Chitinophagaceae bacterium]|nr:DUF308 domain-containing protein [Chitinophagaceae bacterium]